MMNKIEKIKYYYVTGKYKKKHIDAFLSSGAITKEEYKDITGITKRTK